jgi:hypothetical protein
MRPAALSFTLPQLASKPVIHLTSFFLPALMLLVSVVVIRQGRKR